MSAETEYIKKKWDVMPKLVKIWLSIPPVVIDGLIVFSVAMLTAISLAFTGEEAYKYVNPYLLYWLKLGIGSLASGLVALQSFRSKVFADHVRNRKLADQQENG